MHLRQLIASYAVRMIQRFGPTTVSVAGNTYRISRSVFNPRFYGTSQFMAEQIMATPEDEVLDVGTGAGIQAVTAAQVARRVVAVDINPEAVRCAEENVRNNGVSQNVTVLQGDLFSALTKGEKFDIILFTPPYFEGTVRALFDHSLYDPHKTLAQRFFREAGEYLKPSGHILMVYSSLAAPERVLEIAADHGWQYRVLAEKRLRFENLCIYRFTLK